jgi:hypothetical protein
LSQEGFPKAQDQYSRKKAHCSARDLILSS